MQRYEGVVASRVRRTVQLVRNHGSGSRQQQRTPKYLSSHPVPSLKIRHAQVDYRFGEASDLISDRSSPDRPNEDRAAPSQAR